MKIYTTLFCNQHVIQLSALQAQYCDGMKLLEGVSTYRNRLQYSQFRPQVSVSEDTRAWWLYGCQAVLQQHSRVWLVIYISNPALQLYIPWLVVEIMYFAVHISI